MTELYLNIDEKVFESIKSTSLKRYIEEVDGEVPAYYFPNISLDSFEITVDGDELYVSGDMFIEGNNLGYVSMTFNIDLPTIIKLIEHYQKQINKMKTVLEGLK